MNIWEQECKQIVNSDIDDNKSILVAYSKLGQNISYNCKINLKWRNWNFAKVWTKESICNLISNLIRTFILVGGVFNTYTLPVENF